MGTRQDDKNSFSGGTPNGPRNPSELAPAEVKEIMEELEKVNEKLKQSEEVKTQFLSNIRNEVYNPLSSIIALSENLKSMKNPDRQTFYDSLTSISVSARELDYQLNNIFAAAELEAGDYQPDIANIQINKTIEDAIDSVRRRMEQRKGNIKVSFKKQEGEIFFKTDPEKFYHIVINLISNAYEFSEDGKEIIITVCVCEGKLKITVRDFGIGINKEDLEKIFERFRQLNVGVRKKFKGHGLGLSIIKALTDVMSGTINVESPPVGPGTLFSVIIPEGISVNQGNIALASNEEIFGAEAETEKF